MKKCPCHSQKHYDLCCERFHKSLEKPEPEELMRSRYSAYALSNAHYIMDTTHKEGPHFDRNSKLWKNSILDFCRSTSFDGLVILSSFVEKQIATVTFYARLSQDGTDLSFTEKSTFKKVDGKWLYFDGIKEPGLANHLI